MRIIRYIAIFFSGFLMMAAFQNCGESIDLSEQQAASTAPSASLVISSPAMVENNSYRINLQLVNIDISIIQWFKDGVALEGFTGDTLEFAPAQLSDAGEYYATVQIDLETTYVTDPVTLTVSPDLSLQVVTSPSIVFSNITYYLVSRTPEINQQTTDAYCKTVLGANAVATDYSAAVNSTETPRFAYGAAEANCLAPVSYQDGLCLKFDPGFIEDIGEGRPIRIPHREKRITSVSCRPEPIEGL